MSYENSPAVARAMELFCGTKMTDVPKPALFYAAFLCYRVGMCGEVMLSAYATYAQIVEGLACDDDLYALTDEHRRDFEAAQRDYIEIPLGDGRSKIVRKPVADFNAVDFGERMK